MPLVHDNGRLSVTLFPLVSFSIARDRLSTSQDMSNLEMLRLY